jgi:hypothetical protein
MDLNIGPLQLVNVRNWLYQTYYANVVAPRLELNGKANNLTFRSTPLNKAGD